MTEPLRLDAAGRCCGCMPIHCMGGTWRSQRPVKVCMRCGREYDPEIGAEIANWAGKLGNGFAPKGPQ